MSMSPSNFGIAKEVRVPNVIAMQPITLLWQKRSFKWHLMSNSTWRMYLTCWEWQRWKGGIILITTNPPNDYSSYFTAYRHQDTWIACTCTSSSKPNVDPWSDTWTNARP
jgi:hypothetical protein